MSAVKVIRALLVADAAVAAAVGTKIFAAVVPQATALPAICINEISVVETPRIDAASSYALVTSRIQVTVMEKEYPALKDLMAKVRKACNYERGSIAGISVNSITRDVVGPDMLDDDAKIFMQTIDFRVVHHESNT